MERESRVQDRPTQARGEFLAKDVSVLLASSCFWPGARWRYSQYVLIAAPKTSMLISKGQSIILSGQAVVQERGNDFRLIDRHGNIPLLFTFYFYPLALFRLFGDP